MNFQHVQKNCPGCDVVGGTLGGFLHSLQNLVPRECIKKVVSDINSNVDLLLEVMKESQGKVEVEIQEQIEKRIGK